MNDRSATTTSNGAPPSSPSGAARTLVRSSEVTRGSRRSRSWSWPRPTSTATTMAAPRWSRQSVKPPVDGAGVEARRPPTSMPKRSRAASSLSPPRPTKRGGGPATCHRLGRVHQPGRLAPPRRRRPAPGRASISSRPGSGWRPGRGAPARRRGAGAGSDLARRLLRRGRLLAPGTLLAVASPAALLAAAAFFAGAFLARAVVPAAFLPAGAGLPAGVGPGSDALARAPLARASRPGPRRAPGRPCHRPAGPPGRPDRPWWPDRAATAGP